MICTESAETSNRGANLSSSEVMLAKGEKADGGVEPAMLEAVLALRLWMEPYLQRRNGTLKLRVDLKQVAACGKIIEKILYRN